MKGRLVRHAPAAPSGDKESSREREVVWWDDESYRNNYRFGAAGTSKSPNVVELQVAARSVVKSITLGAAYQVRASSDVDAGAWADAKPTPPAAPVVKPSQPTAAESVEPLLDYAQVAQM